MRLMPVVTVQHFRWQSPLILCVAGPASHSARHSEVSAPQLNITSARHTRHGHYLPPKWSIPKKKMAPRASVEGNPRSGAKLLNV